MSGEWTEGPWEVDVDNRGVERVYSGKHEIVRALSEHGARRLSDAERSANRHLIAAAPDLYEALLESRDGLTIIDNLIKGIECHGHYSVESTLTFLRQARQHARWTDSALAQARGEAS